MAEGKERKLTLFKKLFRGREDVFPIYWQNRKGKKGYSPACFNKFKEGVCSFPCDKCDNQKFIPLTDTELKKHFAGGHLIGQYPLLPDGNCFWGSVDFDNHDGSKNPLEDAINFKDTCEIYGISAYIERSKSGNGYHVWVFFADPVQAWKVRAVMFSLLREAKVINEDAERNSFDRLFPNQDNLSGKKLGNLIALPLYGKALKDGNSAFLDKDFNPITTESAIDSFLGSIQTVPETTLDEVVKEWGLSKDEPVSKANYVYHENLDPIEGLVAMEGRCKFIHHCMSNQPSITEPLWYALASNLGRFEGGRDKFHEYSYKHPGYSRKEADEKFDHAFKASGPITCAKIKEDGFNCGITCGVESPAGLAKKKSSKSKSAKVLAGPWATNHTEVATACPSVTTTPTIRDPIIEKNGCICKIRVKSKGGGTVTEEIPITTFTINPIESISIKGEGESILVNIQSGYKTFNGVILPHGCWTSIQKFLNVLPGKETIFTGNSVDIQQIRFHLSTFKMPHKTGIKTSGFHDGKFVTEDGALSSHGISKDTIYFNEVPSNCKLLSIEPATTDELIEIKKHITGFNIPTVTLPILGWTTACFFKMPVSETLETIGLSNGFPLLSIQGEAGSGKTSTVKNCIMRTWAIQGEPKSIGELTRFTMMKMVDGSNTIPLILDENKACMQTEYFQNIVSNLIRATYNMLVGERGKADQTAQTYRYQAPVVIVGETGFTEAAALDRIVPILFSRKDSAPYLQGFKELHNLPLEKLGRTIMEKVLKASKEEIKCILEDELGNVDIGLKDRPRTNAAIARFGLRILGDILDMVFDMENIDTAVKEGIREGTSPQRKSAVDKILEAMCLMSEFHEKAHGENQYSYQDHLEKGIDYDVICDGGVSVLRLHVRGVYPKFSKWAKAYRFEGDLLPESDFKKQLQKEPYFMGNNQTVRIGVTTKRVYILNLDKMGGKGLELSDFWSYENVNAPF